MTIWKAIYAALLFLVIVGVGFAWLSGRAKSADEWEREAKAACELHGGSWVIVGTYPDGRHGLANRYECQWMKDQ